MLHPPLDLKKRADAAGAHASTHLHKPTFHTGDNNTTPVRLDLYEFKALVKWMRAHLDRPLTEESLCAQSTLGRQDFSSAFKARSGLSPMEFLVWLRVDIAVRLVIETRFAIDEIAFVTGLGSEKGLMTAFLETLGVGPRSLRRA